MSDLSALTRPGQRIAAPVLGLTEATIATTPASLDEDVMVLIGDERQRSGPCRWMPRGPALPQRGDRCLVEQSSHGQLAVVWWASPVTLPLSDTFVSRLTTSPQTMSGRLNIIAPTGIALNLDGNLDGQAGANPNPYRVGFGVGCVNGSNGTRGDTLTTDVANGIGASFFAPYYQNATFATKGTITAFTSYMTINEVAGGGYGEAFPFYGGLTSNRKGALTSGIELQNTINAGKPARASAANLIVVEHNAPPVYTGFERTAQGAYTTADLGAGSEWLKGSRVVDVIGSGASSQQIGVGVNVRGNFARPILFERDASNGFAVGSSGWVDVLRSGATSVAFRAYSAAVSKQVEMFNFRVDGKHFWGPGTGVVDTALERSQGGTLKVTSALGLTAIAAASVGNNTIFIDSADNVLKFKDAAGALVVL